MAPELVAGRLGATYRLAGNTTLVSPEFEVPDGAQTVLARARGRVPVAVTARVDGLPEREVAFLTPGGPAARHIPLPGLEGQRVRLVFDPLPALGQSVEIGELGRLRARLPGWRLVEGVPEVRRAGGRRALRAVDEPAEIESGSFSAAPRGRFVRVALRGAGRLRVQVGDRRRTVRATRSWRHVTVPIGPASLTDLRLRLRLIPAGGPLWVRDLGLVVRPALFSDLRVSRRPRLTIVRGRVGPDGAGVRVGLVSGGAEIAGARADRRGRWVVRTRDSGSARLVVDDPERFHPGRTIRLSG